MATHDPSERDPNLTSTTPESTAVPVARRPRRQRFPRTLWAGRSVTTGSYRIVLEGRYDLR